jgi:hypothetical protein
MQVIFAVAGKINKYQAYYVKTGMVGNTNNLA